MTAKIYAGAVEHARLAPGKHSFRYPVYFYAFELDQLAALARDNPLFGYNQLRPVAIHDRDYLTPGPAAVTEKLAGVLDRAGIDPPPARVTLVTAARYFNYVFNPVSFFYCYDQAGRLFCILAQVNNTFGEMHLYLLPPELDAGRPGKLLGHTDKAFHVSPFFPRRGHYEFHLTEPLGRIDNSIRYSIDGQLALVARIHGQARPLTPAGLAKTLAMHPVCASLTMPRILWQAARLHWQRKLSVYAKPAPASSMTVRPVPAGLLDRLGRRLVERFLARLPQGELTLVDPAGRESRFGPADSGPVLRMTVREHRFFRRVMLAGDIGFGEAYTEGDWTTTDLSGLLTLLAANEAAMDDRSIVTSTGGRLVNYLRHLWRPNTLRGSSRNIREHYDLSNAFFATFLDPTMTYSCAIFRTPQDSLEQAQRNKLHAMIEKAGITQDDHVLEIGFGWGSFAIEAVRRTGCRVTGITVSREQLELARQRVRDEGLEERIDLRFCDYRQAEGQYSKVVSIEMLEAVGHAGLGPFFAACERVLRPGGRGVIQVITIPDRKYTAYRYSSDWIRKHIFPGGHLPSVGAITRAMARHSTLDLASREAYGLDYARTLEYWRQTLLERRQEILEMGFDEAFIRKWDYYFAYCQAGFAAQIIDLTQIVLTRPAQP